MCGIAGIVRWQGNAGSLRDDIERMTRSIAHRGPDGEGVFVRDQAALGTRRLAIIDLETGQQPMFTEDGQVAITFNGEIYNYRDLMAELQSKGYVFRTKSDTEVILHSWEEWGKHCVERFRGMFAFAIFDWRQQVVFLARDHFGIKPLYYSLNKQRLIFASEIQALRVLPDCPAEIDLRALDQYLFLQYIPAPLSIFRNILKLSPAHRLLVHMDGRQEKPEKYWSLQFKPQKGLSLAEWSEGLDHVIRDSVKAHLVSDVPFGALLSGGLDSTTIVGMMAEELGQQVQTFTIGFEEGAFSEVAYAQQVAKYWKTDHKVEIIKPDATSILPKLAQHYGEPFGDSSAVPTYYVCSMARQFVPMVLSGDGGDEAFAGYESYKSWQAFLSKQPSSRPVWKKALRPLASAMLPARYPANPEPGMRTLSGWQSCIQYSSWQARRNLWRKDYRHLVGLPVEIFKDTFRTSTRHPSISQAQLLDYATYLPNDILTKVDIASMMHGLEVRTPLVDLKVVEFAAKMPVETKLAKDASDRWVSKKVLKHLLSRHFPDEFIHREKKGFSIPIRDWLSPGGALREELQERLLKKNARISEYFEPEKIASMVKNHGNGHDYAGMLWLLLFLEVWLEELER